MTETLQAIVGTTTYNLSDDTTYTWMQSGGGFGMAPVRRLTQTGPQQHGASDLGFRLEPRRVQLALLFKETTEANYWARRGSLLQIFRPTDDPIKLRVSHAGGTRQLDCYYSGALDLADQSRARYAHQVAVELYAPDPTWYDPTAATTVYTGTVPTGSMAVPLLVPLTVGGGVWQGTTNITNSGDWQTYPTITVQGPCNNALIENLTTGEKLDLSYDLVAGETVTIDLSYGRNTAYKQPGSVNVVGYISTDSDLATFHLASAPEAPSGVNNMKVVLAGAAGDVVYASISHNPRYVGI